MVNHPLASNLALPSPGSPLLPSGVFPPLTEPRLVFNLRGWNPRPAFWVEPGWVPRIFSLSMAPHWQGVNCRDGDDVDLPARDLQGISYLLFPAPGEGKPYSAHFDPLSPYFYAFFGLYVIPPVEGRRVSPALFSELGNRDNLGWLKSMGDPQPYSRAIAPTILTEIEAEADASQSHPPSRRWSFLATYELHSGLGLNNPRQEFPAVLLPPHPDQPNSWETMIDSYQTVVMTCRGFIWYEGDYLMMNFFNGVDFTTKLGQKISTYNDYPEFREQLLRMSAGIKIITENRGFVSPQSGTLAHW